MNKRLTKKTPLSEVTSTPFSSDDYFFYGLNHSSLINASGYDDFTYGPFIVSTNFTAFNKSYNSFYINVNGYVS